MKKSPHRNKTTSQLKKCLDKYFSIYIRQKYADENGEVSCYTCGERKHYKQMQNGHFVSRVYLATRFNEKNCRPQCVGCNLFGNGKVPIFAEKLEDEEEGITSSLYREANKIVKDYPYLSEIEKYKSLCKL